MQRLILFGLLALTFGCGMSNGPSRASVQGQVTLDGEPIAKGSIAFSPIGETKGPSAGATIRDGLYEVPLAKGPVAGHYRVEIRASRKTGRRVPQSRAFPDVMTDEIVETVPDRYNRQSSLEREIQQGKNVLDFALTSQ